MTKAAISIKNVTKRYGRHDAVKDLSLDVPVGSVFGFLGANGAGKSTTINMIVDFIRPTSGTISVLGMDSVQSSLAVHRRIGFLTGDFALDKGLTGWQQLEYFGHLRGGFDKEYVQDLAERLECQLDKKFKSLSRGNKQKVGLIAALMHQPDVLILDEPTSGLDPLMQAEFNKIILEQKARGATVFISSHVLGEVQEICDQVAFIRSGSLIAQKSLSQVLVEASKRVVVGGIVERDAATIIKSVGVKTYKLVNNVLEFDYAGDINKLIAVLARYKLKNVLIKERDLEDIFMNYYEAENA